MTNKSTRDPPVLIRFTRSREAWNKYRNPESEIRSYSLSGERPLIYAIFLFLMLLAFLYPEKITVVATVFKEILENLLKLIGSR